MPITLGFGALVTGIWGPILWGFRYTPRIIPPFSEETPEEPEEHDGDNSGSEGAAQELGVYLREGFKVQGFWGPWETVVVVVVVVVVIILVIIVLITVTIAIRTEKLGYKSSWLGILEA